MVFPNVWILNGVILAVTPEVLGVITSSWRWYQRATLEFTSGKTLRKQLRRTDWATIRYLPVKTWCRCSYDWAVRYRVCPLIVLVLTNHARVERLGHHSFLKLNQSLHGSISFNIANSFKLSVCHAQNVCLMTPPPGPRIIVCLPAEILCHPHLDPPPLLPYQKNSKGHKGNRQQERKHELKIEKKRQGQSEVNHPKTPDAPYTLHQTNTCAMHHVRMVFRPNHKVKRRFPVFPSSHPSSDKFE